MMASSKPPLVSVVISTFNRRPLLEEAVASVVAQSYEDWEILVVDDASSDDTWEWLSALVDKRIRLFRQPVNKERSAARNRGLAEARGELILFLDDDDRLLPLALRELVDLLAEYPEAVAAVGGRIKFRDAVYRVKIPHTPWKTCREIWPELTAAWGSVSGQNLYRTSAVRAVGGYPEHVCIVEDRKMWLDVALIGPVALTPTYVMEYRDHGVSRVPANIKELRLSAFMPFLDSLQGEMAIRGRRAREFGAALESAGESVWRHLSAFWVDPKLALSPLTGPLWLISLAKALLAPVWRPRRLG
jgi:glycosyltransferase involved in cell wall biosynthesis